VAGDPAEHGGRRRLHEPVQSRSCNDRGPGNQAIAQSGSRFAGQRRRSRRRDAIGEQYEQAGAQDGGRERHPEGRAIVEHKADRAPHPDALVQHAEAQAVSHAAAEASCAEPNAVPDDHERLDIRRLTSYPQPATLINSAPEPDLPDDMSSDVPVDTEKPASAAPAITLPRPAVPSITGRTTSALGTFCSVLVTTPAALDAAQQILSGVLVAIEMACSRFRPDSELSALNRSSGQRFLVSPLFARALTVALRAAAVTDGDVDPTCGRSLVSLGYDRDFDELAADTSDLTVPPAPAAGWQCVDFDPAAMTVRVPEQVLLDFGATAKALAADLAAAAIWAQIGCGVLVNLGGDIAIAGQPPAGGWRIGVDNGMTGAGKDVCVAVEAGGVATSSPAVRGWRRGDRDLHHIVVPSTGQPAEIYWAVVSVAAATCVDANTASTASIIRGRAAQQWLQGFSLPARLARPDGQVTTTGGWPL
jgi:thiamine biosynthesis lipoprotein